MPLKIAVNQVQVVDQALADYALQLGITSLNMNTPSMPTEKGYWTYDDLLALRERCEGFGLTLEVIENIPFNFYDQVMMGGPLREEQLRNVTTTIANMSKAGIPMLGFHFMPGFVWRTTWEHPTRGGALASAYDHSLTPLGNKVIWPQYDGSARLTADELWQNYQVFLDAVLPVCEEVGVTLAQHPDDPPVESIEGIDRIFISPDAFSRALELAKGSPAWGIDLCLGTVSEMNGAQSVHEMIERFGPDGRIRYVHFRDVQGTVPNFVECFIGDGNYDPYAVIMHLLEVGFDGWLQDDHVPVMTDDTPWAHRGRAHAIGYMQGMLRAIEAQQRVPSTS